MSTMSSFVPSFAQLSDKALLVEAQTLAAIERRATAQLIAALAELDTRRLYLQQGCRSMFTYCTEVLHLSEYAAYARIEAARAARRFPCPDPVNQLAGLDTRSQGSCRRSNKARFFRCMTAESREEYVAGPSTEGNLDQDPAPRADSHSDVAARFKRE